METYEINKDTVALIPKDDNKTIVYGKAYHLGNGSMHCICENNKSVRIQ